MVTRSSLSKSYSRKFLADGVLADTGDEAACPICDRPAASSIYYPEVEDLFTAPSEIPRVYMKMCKGHYDMSKAFIKKNPMPVSLEVLVKKFTGVKRGQSSALKGWVVTEDTPPVAWFNKRTARIEDFALFEPWVVGQSIRYVSHSVKAFRFKAFLADNPNIEPNSILTFESYLFDGEDIPVARPAQTSSTMFD